MAVAAPEVVAGGLSYIAADYASQAVYDFGKEKDIFYDEEDAQKTSYMAGGAAAGTTGAATAAGLAALYGTEVGAAGGLLGMAAGFVSGAVFGLGAYYYNKYFG